MTKVRYENAQKECETLKTERERERRQYQEEIEHLRSTIETTGKAMLLLTDQSKTRLDKDDGEVRQLNETVKNLQRKQIHLQRQLDEERNKSFWKRLWAGGRPAEIGSSARAAPRQAKSPA